MDSATFALLRIQYTKAGNMSAIHAAKSCKTIALLRNSQFWQFFGKPTFGKFWNEIIVISFKFGSLKSAQN